jgi:N-acylglucosamine 2-epimerase
MKALGAFYRHTLLDDVLPFWLQHGLDRQHGGFLTCLDRDGSLLDSDKSVWFQGRAGWLFSSLFNSFAKRPEWLEAARSCNAFSQSHCHSPTGKMWFTVTREGAPLRMRRYVFSEAFAAISYAAFSKATSDPSSHDAALAAWDTYLRFSFEPGVMPPKSEPTRPSVSLAPLMIGIATAHELRDSLGDPISRGASCTEWISRFIADIERHFVKPDHEALMESVAPDGTILDHLDGRTLNPGHAIECAWFIMREGQHRNDPALISLGAKILDWMWTRGWDREHGGLLYFTDLHGKPVQEYWHDMKFWWPHCEAIIATLLAWKLTGEPKYAEWHRMVHDWSFSHFPDKTHGEWFGYLHRDGSVSQSAKGNLFKGPFHLPRMLAICASLLDEPDLP